MRAEGTAVLGRTPPRPGGPGPALSAATVADERDVEPLLQAAAAELSAVRLRHAAATRRADAAEAQAAAASPKGVTLEEEATELRRQLQREWTEHLRRLDVELDQVRAEAAAVIDSADAHAVVILRAASTEFDLAAGTSSGSPSAHPTEPPVDVAPSAVIQPVVGEQAVVGKSVVGEQPGFSFVKRVLHHEVGLSLIQVAILLLLLFALVR